MPGGGAGAGPADADAQGAGRARSPASGCIAASASARNPKDTLAKLALGLNELTLTEQSGKVTGQRTGQGVTYDLTGVALYAAKQGATIRLHGTATIGGKTYNYDYFGYLMPAWSVGGRAARHDHGHGAAHAIRPTPPNAPLIASFAATREAASRTPLAIRDTTLTGRPSRARCRSAMTGSPEGGVMYELQIFFQRRRKMLARLVALLTLGLGGLAGGAAARRCAWPPVASAERSIRKSLLLSPEPMSGERFAAFYALAHR